MTPEPLDELELQLAVSTLMNAPCNSLQSMTMGMSESKTYKVDCGGRVAVVKTNEHVTSLSRSVHNLEVLASLSIPVPSVLAWDASLRLAPFAILVMTEVPGRDLGIELASMTQSQMSVLAEQIVSFQRLVGELPAGPGCGFAGIGEEPTRTWPDVVRHPNGYAWADPLPSDTQEIHQRLMRAIDLTEPYLSSVKPVCFLDDLTTKNVMIENGVLTGVVDLDVVCYGDPHFHLGLCAAAVVANIGEHGWFYVEELIRESELNPTERAIVGLYQALFLVNFLGAESPTSEGPWRNRALDAASEGLDLFESSIGGGS